MNPAALSQDQLEKRDRAITEWYNTVDALPENERQTAAIAKSEEIINRVIRNEAQRKEMLMQLQALAPGFDAIGQQNLKRMLAYSTISHVGFILFGILAGTSEGYQAALYYTITYVIMSVGGFGMISSCVTLRQPWRSAVPTQSVHQPCLLL